MTDKRDYDKIFKRLSSLWHNERTEGAILCVKAPKDGTKLFRPEPPTLQEDLERWYNDGEWLVQRTLEQIDKTYYAGEALPLLFPYFGTGGHSKYFAPEASVEYTKDSIWIHPCIEDYSTFSFDFNAKNNKAFQRECDILSYLAREAHGRYFVGMPDNCGSYDALAQLRGNEALLMDFYDEPDAVKHAAGRLVDVLIETGDILFDILKNAANGGSVHGWMNTFSKGKHLQLQCDLSVMLSKELYDEFMAEELRKTASWLDNAIYHLDGAEQTRHLDTILSIEGIHAIQWVQVAGQPPASAFIPELKRIQEAGKGLIIVSLTPNQAIELLENLSPNGLHLTVHAASVDEADCFLKNAEKYRAL